MKLRDLKKQGFDLSKRAGRYNRVGCSQCVPAVINGVATHEHGCPNKRKR